jgi:DNA transformation protein
MPRRHDGFADFVLDQLAALRDVACRAMFGGHGLYQGSTFFGIIHKGRLYFRVTQTTLIHYQAHGMKPFRPNPKQTLKSFYEVPIEIIEDAEQLTSWAELSARR